MKKGFQILLILCLSLLIFDAYGQGCSQCKMLSKQGSELSEESFGSNINWGILYLLIVPYLLLMFLFRHKILELVGRLRKK